MEQRDCLGQGREAQVWEVSSLCGVPTTSKDKGKQRGQRGAKGVKGSKGGEGERRGAKEAKGSEGSKGEQRDCLGQGREAKVWEVSSLCGVPTTSGGKGKQRG